MTIYVHETFENAGSWEREFARTLFRDSKSHLRAAGKKSLPPLRMLTIQQDAVHRSKFGRMWRFQTPSNKKLIIYNQARNARNKYFYGVVIEGGRRPGARMPPPSELEQWVIDKRPELVMAFGVKSAAFIVARAIARNGILPRPIMTSRKMQLQMDKNLLGQMSLMWDRAAARARSIPSKGGG